jgi:CheY-like chemotaxis protein
MSPRILLVEDDETLRTALAQLLSHAGYEVLDAANGLGALRLLSLQPVDLIVTDMLMPEMDGVEMIFAARRLYPKVKIIAISGGGISSSDPHLQVARSLRAHKVMAKPIVPADFLSAVHQVLDSN